MGYSQESGGLDKLSMHIAVYSSASHPGYKNRFLMLVLAAPSTDERRALARHYELALGLDIPSGWWKSCTGVGAEDSSNGLPPPCLRTSVPSPDKWECG